MDLHRLYAKLPVFGQNCLCSAYGYMERRNRYGGRFHEFREWLADTEKWTLDRLRRYQDEQLRRIIHIAYQDVPFWRKRFGRCGISPGDIRSVDDLHHLPILTKAELQDAGEEIYNPTVGKNRRVLVHTSGSTGTPLNIVHTREAVQFQWALWWRHKGWFGVDLNDLQASFGSHAIVPYEQSRPPFWRHDWWGNRVVFSQYHMKPECLDYYVDFLGSRPFVYYSGFPSAIYTVAHHLASTGASLRIRPRAVFTGSENTEDFQRALIEKYIAPVTSHYCGAEYGANASMCSYGYYHVDMECGILEIVPVEGLVQESGKRTGKIVITGFNSEAMPLIRYDMNDIGTMLLDFTCPCGRVTPVLERIDGRSDSYIITSDGRRIGRISRVFMERHWIKEAQVVQSEIGKIRVRLVKRAEPSLQDIEGLCEGIKGMLGADIVIDFDYVEQIPRTRAGKFRAVISTVDLPTQSA